MEEKTKIKRINGYLHRISPMKDATGKVVNYTSSPVMVEFRPRDLLQVIIGSSILAIPLAFTEETWRLGETLPLFNTILLSVISLVFISVFVYFNFYRFMLKDHILEFIKRIFSTFAVSLIVVGVILTIIQKCPWQTDVLVAIKRILIVAFPASMSATISDVLK
jgi:uncharacterized membrane protein